MPKPKPWIHVAVEQLYNWLRGSLVAQAVQLEHLVDDICATYIARPGTKDILQAGLLSEVSHNRKLDLLKVILADAGWTGAYPDLILRLRRVGQLRNLSVHAVGPLDRDEIAELQPSVEFEPTTIYMRKFGRGGLQLAATTQDDMAAVSADCPNLVLLLTSVRDRFVALSSGLDA